MDAVLAITNLCKHLSEQVGDEFNVPIEISDKMSSTYGYVRNKQHANGEWHPEIMKFSKMFLQYAKKEDIIDIVKHEWCHYYLCKSTKVDHGHDEPFHALCDKIGCHGNSATDEALIPDYAYKYVATCSCCGKTVGTSMKKAGAFKCATGYTSKCCKAPVLIRQNY